MIVRNQPCFPETQTVLAFAVMGFQRFVRLASCAFVLFTCSGLQPALKAQDAEQQLEASDTARGLSVDAGELAQVKGVRPPGPLIVPVFPRQLKKQEKPVSTDLRDSYIILEDGSALSVADWILGSLTKNNTGVGMSDYENRLFLGQVARAMVGMNENLVHHSFVHVRPTTSFLPPAPPGKAMQALQGFVGLVGGVIFAGTPEGWHPAKTGGAFSPLQRSGGDAAILFEGQFSGAMLHSVEDIRDAGIYQIMVDEQKAKLVREPQK